MYIKNILLLFLVLLNFGCSEYRDRKLLFSCSGVFYTRLTDDSFEPNTPFNTVQMKRGLFVGDKTTEIDGIKENICENGHTRVVFGNCDKKNLVNYFTFDLVKHKLIEYDYFSESFRKKKNFPLYDDSIRGEYQCELTENSLSR
jgi:hypothetical protein